MVNGYLSNGCASSLIGFTTKSLLGVESAVKRGEVVEIISQQKYHSEWEFMASNDSGTKRSRSSVSHNGV